MLSEKFALSVKVNTGDLVLVDTKVAYGNLKPGNNIVFRYKGEDALVIQEILHKVVSVSSADTDGSGVVVSSTYEIEWRANVSPSEYMGKQIVVFRGIGSALLWLRQRGWLVISLALVILGCVLWKEKNVVVVEKGLRIDSRAHWLLTSAPVLVQGKN